MPSVVRAPHVERVDHSPRKEVYNPGDVINVSVHFRERFVGQCEGGLVRRDGEPPPNFRRAVFARSNDRLYEGQAWVYQDLIGSCVLVLRVTPVGGQPSTYAIGDRIFEVRPIRP